MTNPLRHVLAIEYKNKYKDSKVFNTNLLPDIYVNNTLQNNDYDCGLFLLQYVEQFLKEPEETLYKIFTEPKSLETWIDLEKMAKKREAIKKLIRRLVSKTNPSKKEISKSEEQEITPESLVDPKLNESRIEKTFKKRKSSKMVITDTEDDAEDELAETKRLKM